MAPERPAPPECWAEVRAHDRVIRYRRRGVGRPVVVLRPPDDGDGSWPGLLDALGHGFRLILPELPAPGDDPAAWLAGFLEGLGTSGVGIVAADRFCLPVLELALQGAAPIDRVVLVPDASGGEGGLRGALETVGRSTRVPLLVVRRGRLEGDGPSVVVAFLGADGR